MEAKMHTNNPINQYLALRIWDEYKSARDDRTGALMVDFVSKAKNMLCPVSNPSQFRLDRSQKVTEQSKIWEWGPIRNDYDRAQHITYSTDAKPEYIRVDWSLLPAKIFYLSKLEEYGKCIIKCRICGTPFWASSLRFQMCSDACRRVATRQNLDKVQHDSNTELMKALSKKKTQYWRNNINKAQQSPDWTSADVEALEAEFAEFKKRKKRKNTQCRHGRITLKQLEEWYFEQERILLNLMYPN